jgi:hypothetical protein
VRSTVCFRQEIQSFALLLLLPLLLLHAAMPWKEESANLLSLCARARRSRKRTLPLPLVVLSLEYGPPSSSAHMYQVWYVKRIVAVLEPQKIKTIDLRVDSFLPLI